MKSFLAAYTKTDLKEWKGYRKKGSGIFVGYAVLENGTEKLVFALGTLKLKGPLWSTKIPTPLRGANGIGTASDSDTIYVAAEVTTVGSTTEVKKEIPSFLGTSFFCFSGGKDGDSELHHQQVLQPLGVDKKVSINYPRVSTDYGAVKQNKQAVVDAKKLVLSSFSH